MTFTALDSQCAHCVSKLRPNVFLGIKHGKILHPYGMYQLKAHCYVRKRKLFVLTLEKQLDKINRRSVEEINLFTSCQRVRVSHSIIIRHSCNISSAPHDYFSPKFLNRNDTCERAKFSNFTARQTTIRRFRLPKTTFNTRRLERYIVRDTITYARNTSNIEYDSSANSNDSRV